MLEKGHLPKLAEKAVAGAVKGMLSRLERDPMSLFIGQYQKLLKRIDIYIQQTEEIIPGLSRQGDSKNILVLFPRYENFVNTV